MFKGKSQNSVKYFLTGILAVLIIAIIILASVPPVSRDALIHHLAIPKLYLSHGGLYEISSSEFSYYPMNLELLYLLPLYFGNDIVSKYIHFCFALLTALLIYRYIKKRINIEYALFGSLIFLSTPVVVKLSITAYVDLGLIFFSTASLMALLKWVERQLHIKYLLLAAVSCGLAMGTKYNGLIVFFLMTSFIPFIYLRSKNIKENGFFLEESFDNHVEANQKLFQQGKAIGFAAVFALVALLVFSPWMIKNYIWTQNPIYPLFDSWFNTSQDISANSSISLGHFGWRAIVFKESWWEIALVPLRIFFQGQDNNPKYFDGQLNLFLLLLPVFAFYRCPPNHISVLKFEKKIFFAYSILYLLIVFFQTDMRIRYVSPIIPFAAILAIFGLSQIEAAFSKRFANSGKIIVRSGFALIALAMIGMNVAYIEKQFRVVNPLSYISGKISRHEYIERYRPAYAVMQFANKNIPKNSKILCFFLRGRRYYSDVEMLFDEDLFKQILKTADVPGNIWADLKKRDITHFLIRLDLFNQWLNNNFDDNDKRLISVFRKDYLNLLFSKGGYALYQLK